MTDETKGSVTPAMEVFREAAAEIRRLTALVATEKERADRAERESGRLVADLMGCRDGALVRDMRAQLNDWGDLLIAVTCAPLADEFGKTMHVPALWPNNWHQACASVAFIVKRILERAQAAEAALLSERELVKELREALTGMLDHYVSLVNSGDAGNWDAEIEPQVITARTALARSSSTSGTAKHE
jgi:hypothetical protein